MLYNFLYCKWIIEACSLIICQKKIFLIYLSVVFLNTKIDISEEGTHNIYKIFWWSFLVANDDMNKIASA